MSRWPTEKHFASWLALAPGNKVSGGKKISGRTKASASRAAAALRQSANALYRSKSALGAYYRRMKARLGAPKPSLPRAVRRTHNTRVLSVVAVPLVKLLVLLNCEWARKAW